MALCLVRLVLWVIRDVFLKPPLKPFNVEYVADIVVRPICAKMILGVMELVEDIAYYSSRYVKSVLIGVNVEV